MDTRNARATRPLHLQLSRRRAAEDIPSPSPVEELKPSRDSRADLLSRSDYLRRHPELLDHLLE